MWAPGNLKHKWQPCCQHELLEAQCLTAAEQNSPVLGNGSDMKWAAPQRLVCRPSSQSSSVQRGTAGKGLDREAVWLHRYTQSIHGFITWRHYQEISGTSKAGRPGESQLRGCSLEREHFALSLPSWYCLPSAKEPGCHTDAFHVSLPKSSRSLNFKDSEISKYSHLCYYWWNGLVICITSWINNVLLLGHKFYLLN